MFRRIAAVLALAGAIAASPGVSQASAARLTDREAVEQVRSAASDQALTDRIFAPFANVRSAAAQTAGANVRIVDRLGRRAVLVRVPYLGVTKRDDLIQLTKIFLVVESRDGKSSFVSILGA